MSAQPTQQQRIDAMAITLEAQALALAELAALDARPALAQLSDRVGSIESMGAMSIAVAGAPSLEALLKEIPGGSLAVGEEALKALAEAPKASQEGRLAGNTAVGFKALTALKDGKALPFVTGNTAVGREAGVALDKGIKNTLVGDHAGASLKIGAATVAEEEAAGVEVPGEGFAAGFNVLVGARAGEVLVLGQHNVVVGANALEKATKGSGNTAIGANALERMEFKGNNLVAIGISALEQLEGRAGAEEPDTATVAIGLNAGARILHTRRSVLIGSEAHRNGESSSEDVAIGHQALGGAAASTKVGGTSANIAIGAFALGNSVQSGTERNVCIGYNVASNWAAAHQDNIAIGFRAGRELTGGGNVLIGSSEGATGVGLKAKEANVCIGYQAGLELEGSNNVLLGREAGKELKNVSGVLVIANKPTIGEAWIRGEESGKKLSFYGVAPVARAGAIAAIAALGAAKLTKVAPSGWETEAEAKTATERITELITAVNAIRAALKNIGITE